MFALLSAVESRNMQKPNATNSPMLLELESKRLCIPSNLRNPARAYFRRNRRVLISSPEAGRELSLVYKIVTDNSFNNMLTVV